MKYLGDCNPVSCRYLAEVYGNVPLHHQVGNIIKKFSVNKKDIYETALDGIKLSSLAKVVDLGCGYGQFAAHLAAIAAPGTTCIGVDCLESNSAYFLNTIDSVNLKGRFVCDRAEYISGLPNHSIDLFLAGYSLYYFPNILPLLITLLKPNGYFIAITHSENSIRDYVELMNETLGQMAKSEKILDNFGRVLKNFSAENGQEILNSFFSHIEIMKYKNRLVFPVEFIHECCVFLDFKLKSLVDNPSLGDMVKSDSFRLAFHDRIRKLAIKNGSLSIHKDDVIFRCQP